HEILSGGMRGQSAPYGTTWAKWRKLQDDSLNETAVRNYRELLTLESTILLQASTSLVPSYCHSHLFARRFVESVLLSVSYGRRADHHDALAAAHVEAKEAYQECVRSAGSRRATTDLYLAALRGARARPTASLKPSLAARCTASDTGMSETALAYALSAPFTEGRDPLLWSIQWCLVAALLFPAVQQKLHAELDAVVGPARLPDSADRARLPYLAAFIKECARYWPIVPLVRRSASTEATYGKWTIPRRAVIIANIDAIAKDPALFPDPREFRPERFLNARVQDTSFLFGAGTRTCPGVHLALEAQTLVIARILWAFTLARPPDAELPLGNAFTYRGYARGPAPFRVAFVPRGDEVERVVAAEAQTAARGLRAWEW
ncbi:cytochrome P450, partial [Vararia minispora EC-137]